MASTILVLAVAILCIILAWSLLRGGHTEVRSLSDWEARKYEVDIQILRNLLASDEERYLRSSLSRNQFCFFHRKRTSLALGFLKLFEANAGMLMRLGQLARMKGDRALTQRSDELIAAALQFRWNVLLLRFCLYAKWLLPSWRMAVPGFEARYRELMACFVDIQQCYPRVVS